MGGDQNMNLATTAPATVTKGSNFHVKLAPTSGGTASGAEIKNMKTYFQIPTDRVVEVGTQVAV